MRAEASLAPRRPMVRVSASIWIPWCLALAALPVDAAFRRPGFASLAAAALGGALAKTIARRGTQRRTGGAAFEPPLAEHWAFGFARETAERRRAAALALVALAASALAAGVLRRAGLGFLKPLPDDVAGLDIAAGAAARFVALHAAGIAVWFGSRWIHYREVEASIPYDEARLRSAAAEGRRTEAVQILTNLFFHSRWESRYAAAFDAAGRIVGSDDTGRWLDAKRAAASLAERARPPWWSRNSADAAIDERLRRELWKALHRLT